MISAAGILFITPGRRVLFLKRRDEAESGGLWAFPGGKTEAGETAEETATRETREEIGFLPAGSRAVLTRSISIAAPPVPAMPAPVTEPALQAQDAGAVPVVVEPPEQVDFTTFLQRVDEEFVPTLNYEHTAWAWADIDSAPMPIHPGAQLAVERLDMDELDVAQAMAAGRLTSPQRFENVTLWNIRITATGLSYRPSLDENVWRDPSIYMNERFLARCNGLAVIMNHPKKSILNSEEFEDRVIGAAMLPYLRPELDEVWAIVKIYDDAANLILTNEQMSTSPAVLLRTEENSKMTLDDGKTLIIEGRPYLLDHIAICAAGVWDKGGEPSGVISDSIGDRKVTEKVIEPKADEGPSMSQVMDAVGALAKRFDAMDEERKADKARKDAAEEEEKAKADKARKDSEDEEARKKADSESEEKAKMDAKKRADEDEEKAKADAAFRADAAETKRRLDEFLSRQSKPISDAERTALFGVQAKADRIYQALGDSAPRPLEGEDKNAYRRRIANDLKVHSKALKELNVMAIGDEAAFDHLEATIYADATAAALRPTDVPAGTLREIRQDDGAGRVVTTFYGDCSTWMDPMAGQPRGVSDWGSAMRRSSN